MDGIKLHEVELKKPVHCPWCKATHDATSGVGTKVSPTPGDVFICIDCGQMSLWFGARDLRRPTYEEAQRALLIKGVQEALVAWKWVYRSRGRH
jgi:hypothetical protein